MLFLFFLLLAVVFVGLAVWVAYRDYVPDEHLSRQGLGIVIGLFALAFVTLWFGMGWKEIGPGQVGVKVRFGQVQEGTVAPGLFWMLPFIENVVIYDGRVLAYDFDGIEGATKDLQPVLLTGQINYHIDPQMADRILQEVGGPDDYAGKVFLTPANTALKESTPAYTAQEIIAKRDEIGLATEAALDDRMAEYHIVIDRVSVSNVGLDAEFLASVEKKQIAQQDLARADFEAQTTEKHAEGEANAAIQRATGEAEAIRVRAIAQAEANDKLNDSLTPNVIQWQSIQRLSDKVRIMLVPADDNLILDIGDPLASPQP